MTDGTDNSRTDPRQTSADAGHQPVGGTVLEQPGPKGVSTVALGRLAAGQVTGRRSGQQAEVAALGAALWRVKDKGDFDGERSLSAKLARLLAKRGYRLAEATKLARRSLLMGEDAELREELSSWFAGSGEFGLAAGTLRPLTERAFEGADRAAIWMRIAVLSARGGEGEATATALKAAAEADRSDPLPLELLGSLYRWTPESVSAEEASKAFFEAAQRRRSRSDLRGATDALLQAFEAAPDWLPVVEQLTEDLCRAGRFQAADELWREAAAHSTDANNIHARRIRDALGYGDVALALGAALDQGADCGLDVDGIFTAASLANDGAGSVPVPNFDGLLAPAGLTELLAARLEISAERHEGSERSKALLTLARLVVGPLGDPRRAARILGDALLADPTNQSAAQALREYASSTGSFDAEAETLVRIAESSTTFEARKDALEQLAFLADQQLVDPACGLWSITRLQALGHEIGPELAELEQRLRAIGDLPIPAWEDWSRASMTELRRALDVLAQRPDHSDEYLAALKEMRRRDPSAARWTSAIARVYLRQGKGQELEELWREELRRPEGEQRTARLGLCRLYRARGAPERALACFEGATHKLDAEEAAAFSVLASLYGSNVQRALGLRQIAEGARSPVRAALLSVASELMVVDKELSQALSLAEAACHAGPSAARPVIAYSEASRDARTRVSVLAVERACEVTLPRAKWCRRLAEVHPDPQKALNWLRRWASLSSLDAESAASLLKRLVEVGDLDQLVKGLDWLLGQPMPMQPLTQELIAALELLADQNSPAARNLSRRLLGVFGVKNEPICDAIVEISERLGEPLLQIAVIERRFMARGRQDAQQLLTVAELRNQLTHTELAYDACLRALDENAEPESVKAILLGLPQPDTSDAQLLKLQLSARLSALSDSEPSLAKVYRELAAGYWDLAADARNAISAWEKASDLDEASGDEVLAQDLIAFGGYERALKILREIAARRPVDRGAHLLAAAGNVALSDGFREQALELGLAALRLDPTQTEALAPIEQAATDAELGALKEAYKLAYDALLGSYGERALCYRAAREFERRRLHDLALEQAVMAFEAVPAEGVTFALMLRLASFGGKEQEVVRALERVAQKTSDAGRASHWLERAAAVAGEGTEGQRLRVEILFRALTVRAGAEAVDAVNVALKTLFASDASEQESLRLQFDDLARNLLRRLDGEPGAHTAMAVARAASEAFADGGLCAAALGRLLQLDPSTELFSQALPWVDTLAERPGSARPLLEEIQRLSSQTPELHKRTLRFGVGLAEKVAQDLLPALLVALARLVPEEAALVARAEALAKDDPKLLGELRAALNLADGPDAVFTRVEVLQQSDPRAALGLLSELLSRDDLSPEQYTSAFEQLVRLHGELQDDKGLELMLTACLESELLPAAIRASSARRLAELLVNRGAHAAALDILRLIEQFDGMSPRDMKRAAQIAAGGSDAEQEIDFLEALIATGAEESDPVANMRRLVALYESQGQHARAVGWASRILQHDPADREMSEMALRHAEQMEDWLTVAQLLQTTLVAGEQPTEYQVLQLVDTFASRLQDPEAAAEAIEKAFERVPPSAVLYEKQAENLMAVGRLADAAEAYRKASRLVREPRMAARLAELAVRGFLEAGEVGPAAEVLASKSIYPQTEPLAELRVQVAAKQKHPEAEAAALEELAYISMASAEKRARLLRRSAELSLRFHNPSLALTRAQRAARIAPTNAEAQVYARLLEYKARGAGTPDEALTTISELRSLGQLNEPELVELRAFLLAEALECRVGQGAGLKELQIAEAQVGLKPLIALGLLEQGTHGLNAERMAQLRTTVMQGDLKELRSAEQVAELCKGASVQPLDKRSRPAIERDAPTRPVERSRSSQSTPRYSSSSSGEVLVSRQVSVTQPPESLASQTRTPVVPRNPPQDDGRSFALPRAKIIGGSEGGVKSGTSTSRPSIDAKPPPKPALGDSGRPDEGHVRVKTSRVPRPENVQPQATIPRNSPVASGAGEQPFVFEIAPGASSQSIPQRNMPNEARSDGQSVRPRLDQTLQVEQPSVRDSRPVEVTVSKDPRTLGETMVTGVTTGAESAADAGVAASTGVAAGTGVAADTGVAAGSESAADTGVAAPPEPSSPERHEPQVPEQLAKDAPRGVIERPRSMSGQTRVHQESSHSRPSLLTDLETTQLSFGRAPTERPPQGSAPPTSLGAAIRLTVDRPSEDSKLAVPDVFTPQGPSARERTHDSLMISLKAGSLEAGEQLVRSLAEDPARSHEVVAIRRTMLNQTTGDLAYVHLLLDAVRKDADTVSESALLHVLRSLEAPETAPVAPPLHHQRLDADGLVNLIMGHVRQPVDELLSGLWLCAPHLFRSAFLQSGYASVSPDASTPLGHLFQVTSRSFGIQRCALFQQPQYQSDGVMPSQEVKPGHMRVVLDEPITLVLEGSNGNPMGSLFRYHFGAAVISMRPEFALLHGLAEERVQTVLDGVLAAFGPPRRLQGNVAQVAQFAENLWESLPSRMQRRFQELCEEPQRITVEAAKVSSAVAAARAGLFVSGDFGVSLAATCKKLGLAFDAENPAQDLRRLCSTSPVVAELVRFACSAGFAEARWRAQHNPSSSSLARA